MENLNVEIEKYQEKLKYINSLNLLTQQIEMSQKMVLADDLKSMKRVLRRLGFLNKEEIV